MDESELLQECGLSSHESRLYLLLLRVGEATAVALSKESGLHRRTVYDTLDRLVKRGLAQVGIKRSIKHYAASDPSAFQDLLKQRQAIFNTILPSLLSQFRSNEKKVSVNIYEGVGGIKTIIGDVVKQCKGKNEEFLTIGAGLRTPKMLKHSFPHILQEMKKVKVRVLEPDIDWIRNEVGAWEGISCRYLPKESLAPLGLGVYADRCIIMLLEGDPVLIQIIGKSYAKGLRNYFELLWKLAKD